MLNIMNLSNAYIDGLLARLRNTLTVSLFATVESFFLQLAAVAAPVAAVLGALIAVVVDIKVDSLALFLGGAGWALAVVIMYYVGSKLLKSCANTIASNPSNIGSQEYLDVIAFLNLHHHAIGGRPIDVALASDEGLVKVEEILKAA